MVPTIVLEHDKKRKKRAQIDYICVLGLPAVISQNIEEADLG